MTTFRTICSVRQLLSGVVLVLLPMLVSAPDLQSQEAPGRQANDQAPPDTPPVLFEEPFPAGARLYVAPMPNGFDTYVIAGLQQKKVPVVVVALRDKAEYELSGVAETEQAHWAQMLFFGNANTSEMASVKIVNLQTGKVVFAYAVKKGNSIRGKQSAGESVAKHIKQKIEKGS